MEYNAFLASLQSDSAPPELSPWLAALWEDHNGHWDAAHERIQEFESGPSAWVHAYLHRKEGDIWNADYWYRKAGKHRPALTLAEEWEQLVKTLTD